MTTPEPLLWRKSTFSADNGDCVEIAWRTSSFSAGKGNCVEVATATPMIFVRDSKNPGPVLALPNQHWQHLLRVLYP